MYGPLMPSLCYADAPAAIRWLEEAFGFRPQLVVPGPGDTVMHSQLVCEDPPCIVMACSRRDDDYGRMSRPPRELGATTQGLYLVVEDVAAHHARAAAAGAEIVMPPTTQDYGGECYTCKDPEGHVWSFGSYDPRESLAVD
ncbi:VOC family protein [Planctomycetes bacterium Poly30]